MLVLFLHELRKYFAFPMLLKKKKEETIFVEVFRCNP